MSDSFLQITIVLQIWQSAVSTLDESINEIEEAYESSTLNFIKQCQTYDNEFAQEFLKYVYFFYLSLFFYDTF